MRGFAEKTSDFLRRFNCTGSGFSTVLGRIAIDATRREFQHWYLQGMISMRFFRFLSTALLVGALALGCSSDGEHQVNDEENGEDPSTNEWQPPEISDEDRSPLLLVGIDGVKPAYLDDGFADTPNLDQLIENGVWAESLKPVFPTVTFPNLYSIVTGLYPENHGIVGNRVYDPELDETLHMRDDEAQASSSWWGGEPIWVSAEKQDLRAGTFFWVGSEATIDGVEPTHQVSYNSMIPHSSRTNEVVRWLTDEDPVDFATLYFASPDGTGHEYGPHSDEVAEAVENIDGQIRRLIDGLDEAGLWPDINLIIVSDHGMTELDENKVIFLDDIINMNDVDVISWSPVATIDPKPQRADAVYDALKEAEENYTVYRRHQIPDRFHFRDNPRVPEIVVVADKPYSLSSNYFFNNQGIMTGGHGFDPEYPSMHGIFLAHGPDFPDGIETETLQLVDIYALMTHLLGLEAAEHDGSLQRIGESVFRQ